MLQSVELRYVVPLQNEHAQARHAAQVELADVRYAVVPQLQLLEVPQSHRGETNSFGQAKLALLRGSGGFVRRSESFCHGILTTASALSPPTACRRGRRFERLNLVAIQPQRPQLGKVGEPSERGEYVFV